MQAYKIQTPYNYSQKHLVICDSMAEAEKIFMEKYPECKIIEITLEAEYVEVKP